MWLRTDGPGSKALGALPAAGVPPMPELAVAAAPVDVERVQRCGDRRWVRSQAAPERIRGMPALARRIIVMPELVIRPTPEDVDRPVRCLCHRFRARP